MSNEETFYERQKGKNKHFINEFYNDILSHILTMCILLYVLRCQRVFIFWFSILNIVVLTFINIIIIISEFECNKIFYCQVKNTRKKRRWWKMIVALVKIRKRNWISTEENPMEVKKKQKHCIVDNHLIVDKREIIWYTLFTLENA